MAGAFTYPGNTTPTAEWNAWVDPHALKHVLSNWPVSAPKPRICPLNVTESVLLTPDRLRRLVANLPLRRAELVDLLSDATSYYFEFHQSVGVGYQAQIHDLAAAQVLLAEALHLQIGHGLRAATVDVEADSELLRGTTVADWDSSYWNRPANAEVLQRIDADNVIDLLDKELHK